MEAKEIMDIIVSILAGLGLTTCFICALYCLYSMIVVDRQIKQELERMGEKLEEKE